METLAQRDRVATSTPMSELPIRQRIAIPAHRANISAQSDEDILDNPFETEPFVDYDEDDLSEEALDFEFNCIESQRPAAPPRTNNDSQGDRDIWREMEQNECMANIVAALDGIGWREYDIDNHDDGDVETQMVIEQSLRENLDIVAELAAQQAAPPYEPSEDLPTQSLATQAPVVNLPRAAIIVPMNTVPEQVERPTAVPTVVSTAEQDMPPTYSENSEMEWELVSQGSAYSSMEEDGVIVPSSPPPAYSEDSGSDSDGFRLV